MKIKMTWRLWLLVFSLVLAIFAITGIPPKFIISGALVTSVDQNSTAFITGIRQGDIITKVDGSKVISAQELNDVLTKKYTKNSSVAIKTTFTIGDQELVYFGDHFPEISVANVPKTNVKFGLDLSGGARALIQAKNKSLSNSEVADLVSVIENRFNVYGLSDIKVSPVSDLSGNNFVLIEIAGATPKDLRDLISKQGKFEAKIGNETVFIGGNKDVASVCRNDATCAGIETCRQTEGGYFCNFRFSVYLSEGAATRQAEITKNIPVNVSLQGSYLTKPLDLYVDEKPISSLLISEGLRGRVTTQIQISGSGSGVTQEDAFNAAEEEMHKLQTILITGSLPYQLEVVKLDTISPALGNQFLWYIFLAGLAALVSVYVVIGIRYRTLKSSAAVLLTSITEITLTFGIAAFIGWNLDLASLAGIIAAIGTGVDDQIVILDESRSGKNLSVKERIKRAFSIIFGAYFTALVSLLPLLWAGAGLLKGFAITSIIGISVGVLIARPAFADIIKQFEE